MQRLSFQSNKILLTEEMITTTSAIYDLRTAMRKWWINSTQTGGLRLTSMGFKILKEDMNHDSYLFKSIDILKPGNLLTLDNKLSCPYYISYKDARVDNYWSIEIFGAKEATMISLHSNFNAYLKTL